SATSIPSARRSRKNWLEAGRRFSCGPARRAQDSSPVRQHWEKVVPPKPRDGAEEPTSILSPRCGAGKRRRLLPTAGAVGYCLSPYGLCPTRKENVHTGLPLQDEVHP